MCLKKLFPNWFEPEPETIPQQPVPGSRKTALLFAINNYPGSQNDLNGCLNDMENMENMLNEKFPGFIIKKFPDLKATDNCFITEVTAAIKNLIAGDILLVHYSGHGTRILDKNSEEADGYDEAICLVNNSGTSIATVIDDDIGEILMSIPDGATVVLMFDSCYSGTITRAYRNSIEHPTKSKFLPMPNMPQTKYKRKRFKNEDMKWIVYSGCSEQQVSADAYFEKYEGAFTHYALKVLQPGMTYKQWIDAINKELPSDLYEQKPTMEGNETLFNNRVLE